MACVVHYTYVLATTHTGTYHVVALALQRNYSGGCSNYSGDCSARVNWILIMIRPGIISKQ